MVENKFKALVLIATNPRARDLTDRGAGLIGFYAPTLLAAGLINYAPNRGSGYKLTCSGRLYLSRKSSV